MPPRISPRNLAVTVRYDRNDGALTVLAPFGVHSVLVARTWRPWYCRFAAFVLVTVCEIWIFGLIMWLLLHWPACGSVAPAPQHLFDVIYVSAVTYTSVGFGDLAPIGPIRFLTGTEALTGFVLITWSASFTYLEMQRF